jgi:hypothetical protein
MTFKYGLGVPGLFYGCACGQFVLCMFYSKVIMDIDWEQQALEIEKQNEEARASYLSRKSALSIGFADDKKKESEAQAQGGTGKGKQTENDEEKQGLLTSDEGNINDVYK